MRRQIVPSILMVVVFTILTGVVYPLAMTSIGKTAFSSKAEGSLVRKDGKVVGSSLIGQNFTKPQYFHPRPSASGDGYDASTSSGSNKGPTNDEWLAEVKKRVDAYRTENGLGAGVKVPVDAVTASGSGLDPQISIANARLQAVRVAKARGVAVREVLKMIDEHTSTRTLGFLGEPGVNVLELNLALDG